MNPAPDACGVDNLDPGHFVFWRPPAGHVIHVGPEQRALSLPQLALPIRLKDAGEGAPTDNAIGAGVYDYLRQFPDCPHNSAYALLLRDGYPHYLADLAAHVVMLDAKDVEPAYVFRKLSYLKILQLLDPANAGLLWQLAQGFYGLAMTFAELPRVRRHLLHAMRYGQALTKLSPDDPSALNLLAEIDILFGDYPAAMTRFRRLREAFANGEAADQIDARLEHCQATGFPEHPLVDDLEAIGEAMRLYAAGEFRLATGLLEQREADAYFMAELKSADFLCLLGLCRLKTGDRGGAFEALSQALELAPDHAQARQALETF